jgi:hypothetical protein
MFVVFQEKDHTPVVRVQQGDTWMRQQNCACLANLAMQPTNISAASAIPLVGTQFLFSFPQK